VVSYKDIAKLEKITKKDYVDLQNIMGCDPADPKALVSWQFIPSLKEDNSQRGTHITIFYQGLRDYLKKQGGVFKKSEAEKIRQKQKLQIRQGSNLHLTTAPHIKTERN